MSSRAMKSVHEPVVVGLAGMVKEASNLASWNGDCGNIHKYEKNMQLDVKICLKYAIYRLF